MNISPPVISLSTAETTRSRSGSSTNQLSADGTETTSHDGSIHRAASLGEYLPRGSKIISPHNSVLLEPQTSSLQADVFSLSSDFLENDTQFNQYGASEPTQLSSSLLSTHSANAACSLNSTSSNRVRSGSLFSTNSIWNDENLPSHSPDRSVSSGGNFQDLYADSSVPGTSLSKHSSASFLSPNLVPQSSPYSMNNHSRNRSHTTSGSSYAAGPQNIDVLRSNISPLLHFSKDESMPTIDQLYLNSFDLQNQGTRNRSQTYSGVHPKLSQSALPNIISGASAQSSQSTSHNLPEHSNGNTQQVLQRAPLDGASHFVNSHAEPFLQDDFNFLDLSITTNFELPSLGPTNTLLLDNVPLFLDASKLYHLLSSPSGMLLGNHNHGVLSVRVASASNSKMALVVCPSVEVAMSLKANFNHLEITPGTILYVAFAKVTERSKMKAHSTMNVMIPNQILPQTTFHDTDHLREGTNDRTGSNGRNSLDVQDAKVGFSSIADRVFRLSMDLSGPSGIDVKRISVIINTAVRFPQSAYQSSFGPLPEPGNTRRFDAARIREVRKSLEVYEKSASGQSPPETDKDLGILTEAEVKALALDMLEELPELTYDHIGNTIVQKLFTIIRDADIKLMMVKKILPYLAQLGIHKNGTWAIQKIINSSQDVPEQKALIAESLRPYSAKLFNDQFGNYVLQCCLNFGSPYNDFIFEAICNNFVEISSGRFGVRCLRTILETSNEKKPNPQGPVCREQLMLVAGLIVKHANELIMNSNGSLLVTWFLDTFHSPIDCVTEQRAKLLFEQLLPNLDKYCVHKQANATIFKLLSNRSDSSVRQDMMHALFLPFDEPEVDQSKVVPRLLVSILTESPDNNAGPMFVQKVLSTPALFTMGNDKMNQRYHQFAASQVKKVLLEMQISNTQPYKKLFDEVGLSSSRLGRASQGTRRIKRMFGSLRNSQSNSAYHYPMPEYQHAPSAYSPMPVPAGYTNENHVPYPVQYATAGYHTLPTKRRPSSYNAQADSYAPQSRQIESSYSQDAHVMRQLEQLSLQSAALGYTSNPGTPGASGNPNQSSYF